jgi:SagB-type dehydrogenase family enzyme
MSISVVTKLEMPVKNRHLQIGFDFLHKSLYDHIAGLQKGKRTYKKEEEPLPFKVYQKTDFYSLNQMPPLVLGDARWSFQDFRQGCSSVQSAPQRDHLDLETLSTLLYYTYGFSRHDEGPEVLWPFHRFVASVRCFFPVELYLWLPQIEHLPAGIYHYDNLHHGLALVREGEYRDLLGRALDADLDSCLGVLLLSALFWKNAFKYINFSYRLCTQEAGLVTSNASIVAGTLGFSTHVHYQFLDQPLNRLLGFEPDEESLMAVVPLYAGNNQQVRRLGRRITQQSLAEKIEPISLSYVKTSSFDRELCSILTEMDHHSFLEESTEIITETHAPSPDCPTLEDRVAPPPPSPKPIELAQALRQRGSGNIGFLPVCLPLAQEAFWEIVRYGLSVYTSDLQCLPSAPRLKVYFAIQHVEGMDQGIYRLCAGCGMLHVIERGDVSVHVPVLQPKVIVNFSPANLICFLVGDYSAASSLFGNRAYRILNLEAGIIGHRLSVMSASQGLIARYSNTYSADQRKALLKLTDASDFPLAELVIGYERPGVYTESRYQFSLTC